MSDRKEYFKKYYQENKASIAAYYKDKYEQEKKERLTYQAKYYILNRGRILLNAKFRDTTKDGHAYAIWRAITKYAKKWNIPFVPWLEFKEWAMTDEGYDAVYQQWKESEFNKTYSPVAMRGVKKNGFVPDNLKWDYREQYSWWSEELAVSLEREAKMEEVRKVRNARDKEWRKKVYQDFKKKQKEKKKRVS